MGSPPGPEPDSLPTARAPFRVLDIPRCELHSGFFSRATFDSLAEYLEFARLHPLDLAEASQIPDLHESPYSGFTYWLIHLRGYADYLQAGGVDRDNTYVRYLIEYYAPQCQDPGLAADFSNVDLVLGRVRNRYAGFDFFREHEGRDVGGQVLPIRAIVSHPPPREPNVLSEIGSETPIEARLVDGWHRLFAGRVCSVRGMRCEVIEESADVVEMPGVIEQGSIIDGRVLLSGWCVAPDEVTVVELRAGTEMLARSPMSLRPDVRSHFPQVLHAGTSGYCIDQQVSPADLESEPLTLLALCDWLPIGRIRIRTQSDPAGTTTLARIEHPPILPAAVGLAEMEHALLASPTQVSAQISPNDPAYTGDQEHYMSVGRSALNAIRLAMLACGKDSAARILDLFCGYGRVLRWLRATFPAADITACDLSRAAFEFCSAHFQATKASLKPERARIPDGATFDLIWCGSWMSELTEDRWRTFLIQCRQMLAPRGLLVFTTNGRHVRNRLLGGSEAYGISHLQVAGLVESHDCTGYGYAAYPNDSNFGLAITSPAWVFARLEEFKDLELVSYTERGWDRHQDVIACMRR